MNKILIKLLAIILTLLVVVGCLAACDFLKPDDETTTLETSDSTESSGTSEETTTTKETVTEDTNTESSDTENTDTEDTTPEFIDYAEQLKFDPNSGKKYAEATVKSYIDGDTTHFIINDDDFESSYLKARYLAINTPESTGTIEPWGKKASNYTKTQLSKAVSIIVESDSEKWNHDSTGERYLVWVWYKTSADEDYRNLNIEILQQGLAFGSNASGNTYSEYAMGALSQAKNLKLYVFSKEKDPDFYYGGAIELSLKELKANCEKYDGMKVKFEAVVAKTIGPNIYVEEYDPETGMYFGMQIFAGYNCPILDIFQIGNRVSIVGKLSYYTNGGTWQVSDLKYDLIDPNWLGGCRVISTGGTASFRELDVGQLLSGKVDLNTYVEQVDPETGETVEVLVTKAFDYGELAHYTTVTVSELTVKSVYTTTNEESSSKGALTITCVDKNGREIDIRTADKLTTMVDGVTVDVTAENFPKGAVITVRGIVDSFQGNYQVKVFDYSDITFE